MKRNTLFIILSVLLFSLFSCGEKNNYTYDLRSDKIALPVPYSVSYPNDNDEMLELSGENLEYFYNTYLKNIVFGKLEYSMKPDFEITYYFESDEPGYLDKPLHLYVANFNRLALIGRFYGYNHGYLSLDSVSSSTLIDYLMEKGVKQ